MSFDRHYPNRKDQRRSYYGSAAFDRSCRPGGSCPHCRRNYQAKQKRLAEIEDTARNAFIEASEAMDDSEVSESEVQLIHYLIELHKGKQLKEIQPLSRQQVKACLQHVVDTQPSK